MFKSRAGLIFMILAGATDSMAVTKTSTDSLSIQMKVIASCTVYASNLSFGNYTGSALNNTTTLNVTCTNTTPYKVGLDAGMGTGATVTTRKMTSGANTLSYSLYQDAARTIVWGNTPSTNTVSGTGTGLSQILTVYGRIPAQIAQIGSYSDTIALTVYF